MELEDLIKKLNNKSAVIGIIGLGYVGLPLMLRYIESGYKVLALDIDPEKIEKLNSGQTYIKHISSSLISNAIGSFKATTEFSNANVADALIICVPTPLGDHREPDLSFVLNTFHRLLPYIRAGQIISLESTTYPGTTEEELLPLLKSTGLRVGEDVALVYSPEREDPGNPNFSTRTIPKVVGGITTECLRAGIALYKEVIDTVVPVTSTKVAELTKLLENIHRAVNIGLVNEMKILADRMGIDIYEVIRAAATKPFGFVPYFPGPGLGGHCIPIDPFYLTWKAKEYGVNTRFIELAGEVNSNMPQWVVSKIGDSLNQHCKSIKESKILVLGLSYKKNIDDIRESPALELIELLHSKGAKVEYSDPYFPCFPKLDDHKYRYDYLSLSMKIDKSTLSEYDCVLIATNHDIFEYEMIRQYSKLIVDTRGVYTKKYINVVNA